MAKSKNQKTLDGLIKTRTHIETMWVKGTWFEYKEDDHKGSSESVPDDATVIGVCLAGSVLYALDYTDEQWTSKKDVKPIIEAIYDALPLRSKARVDGDREIRDIEEQVREGSNYYLNKHNMDERIYDAKVGQVIQFNDAKHRRKADVLAVIDTAIENVRASIPPTIQELAL